MTFLSNYKIPPRAIFFSRDIDQKTGYKTKTLLCMPIMIQGNVIGVVQMVNKKNGQFTKSDEESFETFAVYCGLGRTYSHVIHLNIEFVFSSTSCISL